DDLRTYIRSLIDREATPGRAPADGRTRFAVRARFDGSLSLVEHALQIMLEGARNVALHARADSAVIRVDHAPEQLSITIDDDGVGCRAGGEPPWSIASRAVEMGGSVRVGGRDERGGHVAVQLPAV